MVCKGVRWLFSAKLESTGEFFPLINCLQCFLECVKSPNIPTKCTGCSHCIPAQGPQPCSWHTAQKMKFSITDFLNKCDQKRWKLRIWSHLLKKYVMENLIFCTVSVFRLHLCFITVSDSTLVKLGKKQPPEVFYKRKGVLWNFAKFTGKHQYQSLFFDEVACLRPAALLKKRLWHRCFLVNFAKFQRTPFLQNTSKRLLLFDVTSLKSFFRSS